MNERFCVFGSAVAHCGVTTATVAVAGEWPDRRLTPMVVEADPSGGDLVARLAQLRGDAHLAEEPSLQTLAAAGRLGLNAGLVAEHLQVLPGRAQVGAIVAPLSGFASASALAVLIPAGFHDALTATGRDVLVDVGRIEASSASRDLIRQAAEVILVVSPLYEAVWHTQELVRSLRGWGVRAQLLVVDPGTSPLDAHAVDQVGGLCEADVIGVWPNDRRGADALCGRAVGKRVLARSALLRAARELADRLAPADGQTRGDRDTSTIQAPAPVPDAPADAMPGGDRVAF